MSRQILDDGSVWENGELRKDGVQLCPSCRKPSDCPRYHHMVDMFICNACCNSILKREKDPFSWTNVVGGAG